MPLPVLAAPRAVELAYTHFTVLLRPDRRLAAATAVDVDGELLRDVEREDDWYLDPRVPAEEQAGEELYADNDLDRGHLVRRRDAVWGTDAEAERANTDTFCYTNAAPQAASFNQDEELWLGLETYLLDNAATYRRRLVVLTGPVLAEGDPVYRGVAVPLRFWKVAAFAQAGALAATAYVLDQTPLVDLDRAPGDPGEPGEPGGGAGDQPPPLGPYRTFQVPVAEVAALTGLDLGPLPAADLLPAQAAWRRLRALEQVAEHLPSGG